MALSESEILEWLFNTKLCALNNSQDLSVEGEAGFEKGLSGQSFNPYAHSDWRKGWILGSVLSRLHRIEESSHAVNRVESRPHSVFERDEKEWTRGYNAGREGLKPPLKSEGPTYREGFLAGRQDKIKADHKIHD